MYTYGIIYIRSGAEDEIRLRLLADSWFDAEKVALANIPDGYYLYGVFNKNVGLSRDKFVPYTFEDYPITFEDWLVQRRTNDGKQ